MTSPPTLAQEYDPAVPVGKLSPHPRNVNEGDVGAIGGVMEELGFFGACLVQRSSSRIIAGKHRWLAAQAEGKADVPVLWADVDDDTALRIMLADNRTARVGHDDDQALSELLMDLQQQTERRLAGTGYDGDALDDLLASLNGGAKPGLTDPDAVPEPGEARTKPGDLWVMGEHRLLCGDATEVESCAKLLGETAADLVLTDPPYFRVVEDEWDDQWGPDVGAFLDWLGGVLQTVRTRMADRATLAVFAAPDTVCGVETEVRKRFAVLNHIVWRKPQLGRLGQMDKESMRRFFPTSERLILAEQCRNPDGDLFRFRDHVNHAVSREVWAELRERLAGWRDQAGYTNAEIDARLGTNGMAAHYFGASQWHLPTEAAWRTVRAMFAERGVEASPFDVLRQEFDSRRQEFDSRRREFDSRGASDWELFSDVWTFSSPTGVERLDHSTQKPAALIEHLVRTCSRSGDLILDPFGGSGTTLIAAEPLGRRAALIEIDPHYCDVIVARYEAFTGKTAELAK